MLEEQARLQVEDPDRARRIRDRLKDVMRMLRPRRFRRAPIGDVLASGPATSGGDGPSGPVIERTPGAGGRHNTGGTRGIGAALTQLDEQAGEAASEVFSILRLDPKWVTEAESEDFPLVNGNGRGLHDRAAALAGEDGITAS